MTRGQESQRVSLGWSQSSDKVMGGSSLEALEEMLVPGFLKPLTLPMSLAPVLREITWGNSHQDPLGTLYLASSLVCRAEQTLQL